MAEGTKATMADIARLSGYSKASVSFAFNQPDKISREAYLRIMEAAKELDYLPDPMAQKLSKGRLNVVGFLLPQKLTSIFNNPYSLEVMKGIGDVCEEEGSTLTVIPPLRASLPEALKCAMVDGVITLGCTLDDSIRDVIRKRHLPVVSVDGSAVDDIVCVRTDDEKAAETQMQIALELGHRSFAIVSLGKNAYLGEALDSEDTASKRLRGYSRALESYGLRLEDQMIITADPSFEQGEEAAREIFREPGKVSCIICMADITAYGIMNKAAEIGVRIPEEYSLIGFDGIGRAGEKYSSLTTVLQPGFEKGRVAARELFSEIKGSKPGENGFIRYIPFSFEYKSTLRRKEKKD